MPATFNEIGVGTVTASLVEKVEVTKKIDHKIVKTNTGAFDNGNKFDPTFEFSVSGRGSASAALVGGNGASYLPDVISGGTTIVTSVKNGETNDDFNTFEVRGSNYPNTTA